MLMCGFSLFVCCRINLNGFRDALNIYEAYLDGEALKRRLNSSHKNSRSLSM